jgi:hypothetical protein
MMNNSIYRYRLMLKRNNIVYNSQGGAQFPTGGKLEKVSPRALDSSRSADLVT